MSAGESRRPHRRPWPYEVLLPQHSSSLGERARIRRCCYHATPEEATAIDEAIAAFGYHRKDEKKELREQLHIALDVILDQATDEAVKHVARELTRLAGKFGGPRELTAPVGKQK